MNGIECMNVSGITIVHALNPIHESLIYNFCGLNFVWHYSILCKLCFDFLFDFWYHFYFFMHFAVHLNQEVGIPELIDWLSD